jgi:hypothetical protein
MSVQERTLKRVVIEFKNNKSDVKATIYKNKITLMEDYDSSYFDKDIDYLVQSFGYMTNAIIGAILAMRAMYTNFTYSGDTSCKMDLSMENSTNEFTTVRILAYNGSSFEVTWEEDK